MRQWALALALAISVCGAASAQPRNEAASVSSITIRGVVAQYRVALVRERRLADERELQIVAAAEAQMRAARLAFATARGDRRAAQAALESTRADFLRVVEALPLEQAAARIELEAFRAELTGLMPRATPELRAAYQEFADGDRATAWRALDTLLRARSSARQNAALLIAAGELRQLATFREIMRASGEADARSVLAIWDQAAALDPSHFWSYVERIRLARMLNDLLRARDTALAARSRARDDRQRAVLSDELGEVLFDQRDLTGALVQYRESLVIARRLYAQNRTSFEAHADLSVSLDRVGDILHTLNDLDGALRHYQEGLEHRRVLRGSHPTNSEYRRAVAISLSKIGEVLFDQGDVSAAIARHTESVEIRRSLHRINRGHTGYALDLTNGLIFLGGALQSQDEFDAALPLLQEGLAIARELHRGDPQNGTWAQAFVLSLTSVGGLLREQGDANGALRYLEEALAISRSLRAADPSNRNLAFDVASTLAQIGQVTATLGGNNAALAHYEEGLLVARRQYALAPDDDDLGNLILLLMDRLARIPAANVSWADVAAFGELLDRRGQLALSMRPYLEGYQNAARSQRAR